MPSQTVGHNDGGVLLDDLGTRVDVLPGSVRRVVSLVPSLTESVAETSPGLLVGATDWCAYPAGLEVVRVGGTKSPRVSDVIALGPDLVLANEEENRREDVEELRAAGLPVWVTAPRTLAQAFGSLQRMLAACGLERPEWLDTARRVWSNTYDGSRPWATAVVPVWRRPWQVLGGNTFAGDMLGHLGVGNVFGGDAERYPKVSPAQMRARHPGLLVLPDEPFRFTLDDRPEELADVPVALLSGRHLTWYGPSLVSARSVLEQQLQDAHLLVGAR